MGHQGVYHALCICAKVSHSAWVCTLCTLPVSRLESADTQDTKAKGLQSTVHALAEQLDVHMQTSIHVQEMTSFVIMHAFSTL